MRDYTREAQIFARDEEAYQVCLEFNRYIQVRNTGINDLQKEIDPFQVMVRKKYSPHYTKMLLKYVQFLQSLAKGGYEE